MAVLKLKNHAGAETIDGTERAGFRAAVLSGLKSTQKAIPSRFLYDKRGSDLFEHITRLEEYYPTRAELNIYERFGEEIASLARRVPSSRVLRAARRGL